MNEMHSITQSYVQNNFTLQSKLLVNNLYKPALTSLFSSKTLAISSSGTLFWFLPDFL